jgi:mono/diheme cytochrome c family protein
MTDALLFTRITQGLPGTAMPAFRDTLTDEERWHVVNYLRALTERP